MQALANHVFDLTEMVHHVSGEVTSQCNLLVTLYKAPLQRSCAPLSLWFEPFISFAHETTVECHHTGSPNLAEKIVFLSDYEQYNPVQNMQALANHVFDLTEAVHQ